MNNYTIYNTQTGLIEKIYSGTEPQLQLNINENYIPGTIDAKKYFIKNGVVKPFTIPKSNDFEIFDLNAEIWIDPRTEAEKLERQIQLNRTERNRLLGLSDWVVARAYDKAEPVPEDWVIYRQALRDITEQPDPFNIVWPIRPT